MPWLLLSLPIISDMVVVNTTVDKLHQIKIAPKLLAMTKISSVLKVFRIHYHVPEGGPRILLRGLVLRGIASCTIWRVGYFVVFWGQFLKQILSIKCEIFFFFSCIQFHAYSQNISHPFLAGNSIYESCPFSISFVPRSFPILVYISL